MQLIRSCPLCEGDARAEAPLAYSRGTWAIKRCPSCTFVFLENAPDYETLESDFSWDRTFVEEKSRRLAEQGSPEKLVRLGLDSIRQASNALTRRDKLKSLAGHYFKGGRILDLGCDTGYNAHALPPGCQPVGIEIAPKLVNAARPLLESKGGTVIHADVLSGLKTLPDKSCQGAIAKSYLEHEIRPSEVLRELERVLSPGSCVIIKVPNFACWNRVFRRARWCGFRFPDHVNYFTPPSLRQLLANSRFRVVRMTMLDVLPTSDNMWCVAQRAD